LFLLVFSILLDYFTGIKIHEAPNKKKKAYWLTLSIVINLGFLGVFKYFNFFAATFAQGLSLFGFNVNMWSLQVILPVGISFYTFHGLSYVLDLYNGKIKPERDFINYSLFVSFFPLLVAGPIERATHLLPQIIKKREFDYSKAVDGCRQILWGLFKKIVIADNCSVFANTIFNNYHQYSGGMLILGALFFTFQIYCDFSGYSDIALGVARLFGIDLLRNFAFPYFSRDIAEFWRRWHISLSSWFRDYLYIPLGGSKGGMWMKVRNTFIIFIVSGFWHGANWTFIVWGALNALYFMPLLLLNKNRNNLQIVAQGRFFPNLREISGIVVTFSLTVVAWIFFRSESIGNAIQYIGGIFHRSASAQPGLDCKGTLILVALFFAVEWLNREKQYALQFSNSGSFFYSLSRKTVYVLIVFAIFILGGGKQSFIYFQF
jgi:D-alanyl-lipoteichoic acid acyltransferase DltB (MBOAT superfamily)